MEKIKLLLNITVRLLIYCYAAGIFISRQIHVATHQDVAVRFIAANTHPDQETLCTFRRENKALLEESFTKILELAAHLKLLKVWQVTVSVDGTKVAADTSKHSAVNYDRAGEQSRSWNWRSTGCWPEPRPPTARPWPMD